MTFTLTYEFKLKPTADQKEVFNRMTLGLGHIPLRVPSPVSPRHPVEQSSKSNLNRNVKNLYP